MVRSHTLTMPITIKIGISTVFPEMFYHRVGIDNRSGRNCLKKFSNQLLQVVHKFLVVVPDSYRQVMP